MRILLALLIAGCQTIAIETIDGPCTMEKTDNVMWPTASRSIKVECQEGGKASTHIGVNVEEEE